MKTKELSFSTSQTASMSTSPEHFEFVIPDFDFSHCDVKSWNGGSAVRSHFWNTMSSLLPNIEFCAIRSLRPLIAQIEDSKLQRELHLFCDQECAHGTHHGQFNQDRLHPAYPFFKRLEDWERHLFSAIVRFLPRRFLLALFVAVEHWTAAFSQYGLSEPEAWFRDSDAEMFKLWEWHAVEELAHKSVCYDVFRYYSGGYLSLVIGMVFLLLVVMLPGIALRLLYAFWRDKLWWRPTTYLRLAVYLFGRGGVLSKTFSVFLKYFNPRFHPWAIDSLTLIDAYRKRHSLKGS